MGRSEEKILQPELSYLVTGLCYKIHNNLGRYRSEKQYADALEVLFKKENVDYSREAALPPSFIGEEKRRNIPDFIVDNKIIIDLKAKRFISKEDYYQMKRYLSSYSKELGIIINFREYRLKPKRILNRINS